MDRREGSVSSMALITHRASEREANGLKDVISVIRQDMPPITQVEIKPYALVVCLQPLPPLTLIPTVRADPWLAREPSLGCQIFPSSGPSPTALQPSELAQPLPYFVTKRQRKLIGSSEVLGCHKRARAQSTQRYGMKEFLVLMHQSLMG